MDTSHVAVGTVMYMITDSLTCRPQKSPAERGAGAALGAVLLSPHKAPLVHRRSMRRSTSEPAVPGVSASATGSTAGGTRQEQPAASPSYTVSPAGQRLKHSRPAPGAAQAVGRHMPSDGCKGDTVSLAVGRWYNFFEIGCHLGNVG